MVSEQRSQRLLRRYQEPARRVQPQITHVRPWSTINRRPIGIRSAQRRKSSRHGGFRIHVKLHSPTGPAWHSKNLLEPLAAVFKVCRERFRGNLPLCLGEGRGE